MGKKRGASSSSIMPMLPFSEFSVVTRAKFIISCALKEMQEKRPDSVE
uniref:Uncharacterized protein n=1 Tax=Arundo donax TaxID=35708 RepID=A0A0A9A8G3_ARUDO